MVLQGRSGEQADSFFFLCPGWIQSDQILILLASRSILPLPQGRQSLLRFLQFSHYFTRLAIPSWGLPVPRMRAQPKQRPVGVHSSQCKQISLVCLGGRVGAGRELSWALLCSEKKKGKKFGSQTTNCFAFGITGINRHFLLGFWPAEAWVGWGWERERLQAALMRPEASSQRPEGGWAEAELSKAGREARLGGTVSKGPPPTPACFCLGESYCQEPGFRT